MSLSQRFLKSRPAKERPTVPGFHLVLLGLALFTVLLAGTGRSQNSAGAPESAADRTELLSYEGQHVVAVEIAGRPDLNIDQLMPLIGLKAGETFSASKIDDAVAALKSTGLFQ